MKTSYKIIRWLLGDKYFNKKLEAFDKIDPDRFFVENIRSYYGMSYFMAQRLCNEAVSNGKFDKKIGIECPECHRIIKSFSDKNLILDNQTTVCDICASLEKNVYEYKTENLKQVEIYSLHR